MCAEVYFIQLFPGKSHLFSMILHRIFQHFSDPHSQKKQKVVTAVRRTMNGGMAPPKNLLKFKLSVSILAFLFSFAALRRRIRIRSFASDTLYRNMHALNLA